MIRWTYFLLILVLAIPGFGLCFAGAQDESAEENPSKSPTCATPASVLSNEDSRPPSKPYLPPPLHQPASTPMLNQPSMNQPSAIRAPLAGESSTLDSTISLPATNRSQSIIEPTPQHLPLETSPPEQIDVDSGIPNQPASQSNQSSRGEKLDFSDMNFSDFDKSNNPCGVPCEQFETGIETCRPLVPLPCTPTQPSIFEPGNCHPGDLYSSQFEYRHSTVEQDPDAVHFDYPGSAVTSHGIGLDPITHRRDELQTVKSDELNNGPGPQFDVADQRQQPDEFSFDNASFQMPNTQAPITEKFSDLEDSNEDPGTGITVHPPMIQPFNRNQHTFVIENRSDSDATDVVVEIAVPDGAKILAAMPLNSVSTPKIALFRFDKIAARDNVTVHVTAISNDNSAIAFEASLVSRAVYSFRMHEQQAAGVLSNVSYTRNPSAELDVQSIPGDEPFEGPVRVKNPFFQSLQQNH